MKRKSILSVFLLITASVFSVKTYPKIIDCPKPPGGVKIGEIVNNKWIVGFRKNNTNKINRKEKSEYNLTKWFTAYVSGYINPTYSIIGCCALINDKLICLNKKMNNYDCDILPANMDKAMKVGKFNPDEMSFKCDKL